MNQLSVGCIYEVAILSNQNQATILYCSFGWVTVFFLNFRSQHSGQGRPHDLSNLHIDP